MDSIHNPSIPSSQTNGVTNGEPKPEPTIHDLIAQKDKIESELEALGGVLVSHGVTMSTPLTDNEGFPRNDIDVAQIATTRRRIIYLKNDYKAIMDKIEKGLHAYFASQPDDAPSAPSSSVNGQPNGTSSTTRSTLPTRQQPRAVPPVTSELQGLIVFAKVDSVAPDSPAATAGLQVGDGILKFGSVDWTNHNQLRAVPEEVQQNIERVIKIRVERSHGIFTIDTNLELTPRTNWGGRGLLGCHLVPL